MEPLITTELENAILRLLSDTMPRANGADVVAQEREITEREARRVLDILHDVSREFIQIELGLVPDEGVDA